MTTPRSGSCSSTRPTIRCKAIRRGRSSRDYYDCYRFCPLYMFCEAIFFATKLRLPNIDASADSVEPKQQNEMRRMRDSAESNEFKGNNDHHIA
jgi:hypothetical protein